MGDGDYCRTLTFSGDDMVFDTRAFPSIRSAGCGDSPPPGFNVQLAKGGNNHPGNQAERLFSPSSEEPGPSGISSGGEPPVKSPEEFEEFLLYDYDTDECYYDDSDVEDSDIAESDPINNADEN